MLAGFLSSLTYLNISGLEMSEIPEEIQQMQTLTTLILRWNKLTTIPAVIFALVGMLSGGCEEEFVIIVCPWSQ